MAEFSRGPTFSTKKGASWQKKGNFVGGGLFIRNYCIQKDSGQKIGEIKGFGHLVIPEKKRITGARGGPRPQDRHGGVDGKTWSWSVTLQ